MTLKVALVRGPMYDHLYGTFERGEVEVVAEGDHPTLNRKAAALLAAGRRIDLLATHSKYAPSQARWLLPLDHLVDHAAVRELAPRSVDLCRFRGQLLCVPRLIDVRVLWARSDRITEAPDTWAALKARRIRFGFPGRESGLFGTFFELVNGAGGELFGPAGEPMLDTDVAEQAIALLCELAALAPADLVDWHYDDVDQALLDGRVDAAGAWPGAWGAISRSRDAGRLVPHPYPAGPTRRVSYAGCHAWAIPSTCQDTAAALTLLGRLIGADAQATDARGGNACAHIAAFTSVEPTNDTDRRRLEITRATIAESMITYPSLVRFPEIEDAGWASINAALCGKLTPRAAAAQMQRIAERILSNPSPQEGHP